MATLKCLACGHDNNVGDEWCSSCSSSLNLRLCSACEAINASDAERCHSCNAEFRIEPQAVTFDMEAAPSRAPVEATASAGNPLPAVWRLATDHARRRSPRLTAVLAVLPLLAAGAAYFFFSAASLPAEAPHAVPKVEAARKSEPVAAPEAVPKEPARRQTADGKPAQAPAVSGRIIAPRTATVPAMSAVPSEPKRTTAAVTHTRSTGAVASGSAAAADAPVRTAVQALPVSTMLPVFATYAPATNAPILPVSESQAPILELRRTSVTHTKADLTESAVATAVPVAATEVRTVPAEARSDEPAGCAPAVLALGLCKSR
jgi:hypothetical protein